MRRLLIFIFLLLFLIPMLLTTGMTTAQVATATPIGFVTATMIPGAQVLNTSNSQLESTAEVVPVDPAVQAAPHFVSGETFALVWVEKANLRTKPSIDEGRVVDIAHAGERFIILGAYYPSESTVIDPNSLNNDFVFDDPNEREVWYLVQVPAGAAWIFGGVVLVANPDQLPIGLRNLTPEEEARLQQRLYEVSGTVGVTNNIRLRSGPGTEFGVLGVVSYPGRVRIIGRNAYGTWAYVNYSGRLGWVDSLFLAFPPGYQFGDVPVIP